MSTESTTPQFAVGYQQPENGEQFAAIVADYRPRIAEVYFAWVGAPSGRAALGTGTSGLPDWSAQERLESELAAIRSMGVKLDLLFNANCYGADAMSRKLADEVAAIVTHLEAVCGGPDIVTTTSPTIAHVVKTRFPHIETRASVNMRIGTLRAVDYAGRDFDGFYLQRDLQRDPDYVRKLHAGCKTRGKKLCLLVNSGCLRFCPAQIFHDNAVAHDAEIRSRHNLENFHPLPCWKMYLNAGHLVEFLKSTWIRPEDLEQYENRADVFKLATRQHSHPRMVIDAYTRGRHDGNLMNLMEPCFAPAVAPRYIDNQSFPADWAKQTARCGGDCGDCDYCERILQRALKSYDSQA